MAEISLAIPVHDSAPFLDELFACLRRLEPAPAEILLLDDASGDDSAARIGAFIASRGDRLPMRLLRNASNAGIAGAYNRLAREARGDFVQLLDADDLIVEPDYYARVQRVLRPDVDLVVTALRSNARALDACSRTLAPLVPRRPPRWWPLLGSFATRAGVVYRRASLLECPFPDPAWPGSDVIHLLHLRARGRCVFLPGAHVHYRLHAQARSGRFRDHRRYEAELLRFDRATACAHTLDLRLREIGQRWLR